jgi:TolB-like protein/Flp pilus assembly protein TadD/tRNA A-37 threonylcarbamoyl transferase component Bud32
MNEATAPPDSVADVIEHPTQCPQCGAITCLDHGTCLNCFLREGIEGKGEGSCETFESILLEANVTDTHWRLGHYEILEEIGRGGMGVIYRARQQHSRRVVAVKRMLSHQVNSHETLVRFRREAEGVASLDHPNILPIHEVSESEEGLPYFSMKYATGGSLRTAARTLRTKPRECVRVMAKIAHAIDYAHSKGILHRDLQPGNILLDENGEPMVSDFGLAKWLDQTSDLTRTLETLGTPGYIAPEQTECPADKLTCAADVYSLGAILFYLLAGRPPFVGPNVLHVIHQAATNPAPRLRLLVPSLDRDLETIVGRCLEPDPKARYQSAGALSDDLEHWLRHEPIRAKHVGPFTRGRKWVRRNPTSAVLVGSLIALALAIAVILWEKESSRPLPPVQASVAVLPFENLTGEPENASFTDGVQDDILNDLTKVADLKVISRTSVMQYKTGAKRNLRQIANELGVTHVVEGRVQRTADRVRISTQLIDARTNRQVWQERYDRPLDSVFAIQSDIAHAIAMRLQAKLSPKEKAAIEERSTSDLAAYDLYLKAKELRYNGRFNPGRREKALFQAVQLLEQAVARDPTFLLAHYQLAFTNDLIYFANYDHTETRLALAQSSIDALVRLRPDAGETHMAQANHFFWGYLNYRAAREELVKAQRELPNNAQVFQIFGQMNRWEGRWEEASQNLQRAVELDPRNSSTITDLAWVYIALREYEEADTLATRLQALEPRSPILRAGRGFVGLEARADTASLRAVLDTIESESPQSATEVADLSFRLARYERNPVAAARALANMPREGKIDNNYAPFPHTWYEGLLAKLRQDVTAAHSAFTAARAETDKLVHAQRGNAVPLGVLALIDAELGDKEKAIAEARTACDMLPSTKNALDGVWLMTNLARIYALTGENDLALEQLEVLSKLASSWFGFSYGDLHLNPEWDSLRGDPRFEKLVEESKKPVALESLRPLAAGIAVLPFENLSADPDNAFFAEGVQDEILNNLAKIADLKVISRTSVMQYKSGANRNLHQIANELGAEHMVEGSVQRAGNRVRVSAQLIDAKTDTHLWAESYDRPLGDVFAIQSEIAKTIARQLQAKLSPSEANAVAAAPTSDPEAYDLFLKGEYEERQAESTYEVKTYDRAATFYRQAVARDPNFVLAYARLAYSRLNRHWLIKRLTSAELEELKSDIERALAIAPDSPDAHLALGLFHYWGRHDFDSALREFDRAIELQPSNAVSREYRAAVYRRRGEWRRALAEFERAGELDPRDVWKADDIGSTYSSLRRWSEAEYWLKHALALDPHHVGAAYRLNLTYIASTGDIRRARQAFEGIPNDKTDVGENPAPAYGIIIPLMVGEIEYLDVLERHFPEALKSWDAAPTNTVEGRLARLMARIGIQVLAGQSVAAKSEAEEARALLEPRLAKRAPQDRTSLSESAWVYVCLGRNDDALRIAREAVESMPIEKDAILGVNFLVGLAQIEAHTGQSEEAVKHLRQLLTMPAGEYISVTRLKIDPVWDPIRNHPGFQKLVSESEPETVYK